jgi:putative DNA primase/helicase
MTRIVDLANRPETPIPSVGIDKVFTYLRERGVQRGDIDALGLRILRCSDIGKSGDPRAAIVFPHHSANGELLDWWSARLVDIEPVRGFAAQVPKSRGKMYCPPGESPAAYLPQVGPSWASIPGGSAIFIHESALKSVAGAKLGFYSVGLNGVWGYSAKTHAVELVEQLRDLPWKAKNLTCVVVYDSNADGSNDQVSAAIRVLGARLRANCTGVTVKHHLLPRPDANVGLEHWGFDDAAIAWGPEKTRDWLESWRTSAKDVTGSPFEDAREQLNQEVVLVRSMMRVAEVETGNLMSAAEFTNLLYADRRVKNDEGESVSVPQAWLKWSGRAQVERLEYAPGQEPLVEGEFLNLWRGLAVEPSNAGAELWEQLIEAAVMDPELRTWVRQWFAYPLQNMGAKLNSFLHLYGPPGGGKNALLTPLFTIYGSKNAISIGQEAVTRPFNSVYAAKQFVNVDELRNGRGPESVEFFNKLKMMVTSPTMLVNRKGTPEYEINNCMNIVTTANYSDSIKLDEGDRRACVVNVDARSLSSSGFWDRYYGWAMRGSGAAGLLGHLLAVDMSGFDPKGHALGTESKWELIEAMRSPMEQWCHALKDNGPAFLPIALRQCKCLTLEKLAWAYVTQDDPNGVVTPASKIRLGLALKDAAFGSGVWNVDAIKTKVYYIAEPPLGEWTNKIVKMELAKAKV